jgi:signal peptidase I
VGKFIKNKKYSNQEKKPNKLLAGLAEKYSFIKQKLSFLKWLDPFTYVDLFVIPRVKQITNNEFVELGVNIIFAAIFAFLFYTILGILFGSSTPLVIVYSASMENTLFRGDVMGLSNVQNDMDFGPVIKLDQNIANVPTSYFVTPSYSNNQVSTLTFSSGQSIVPNKESRIIVYPAFPSYLPIIHRTIAHIKANDGDFVLTKGDNGLTNPTFDADCGVIVNGRTEKPCITLYAVPLNDIQGVAFFNIPKVGCVKLWLVDDLTSLFTHGRLPSDFRGIC